MMLVQSSMNKLLQLGVIIIQALRLGAASSSSSSTITVTSNMGSREEAPLAIDSAADFARYKATHKRFHDDSVCNRTLYNQYKRSLKRNLRKKMLQHYGATAAAESTTKDNASYYSSFPPLEVTRTCPLNNKNVRFDLGGGELGLDTTWMVDNTSSGPVVISLLDYSRGYGKTAVEVSPFDSSFVHAAGAAGTVDPQAIVEPGDFKAVYAYEGQVFTVRRLLVVVTKDGQQQQQLGSELLLQYRAGLRSIGKSHNMTASIDCPDCDIRPPKTTTQKETFERKDPKPSLKCNSMEIGFRNQSPCPLHAYFYHNGTESFRFHLGTVADNITAILQESWQSAVKFETSYIPHTFIFRNAQTSAWVDRYTLQPTRIVDCHDYPQQQKQAEEAHDEEEALLILPSGEVVSPVT